ncbi:hypothetical protein [Alteromonas sp. 76-1]|uniref:hypothetical protein n=1 Tax=Alteromonas sp. 76-1 TaxID=2358187 RepID=UPI00101DB7C2|nr:hypothetical protein [Alteromonas sp. 76-1]
MKKDDLTAYTELFIKCGSEEYIPSPQAYSPLYIRLYSALLKGDKPEFLSIDDIAFLPESTLEDMSYSSTNSFDRYLMANYISPFELSYPLPIPKEDLKYQYLNQYLCLKYGKTSQESDSFKTDRAFKDVLSLFPKKHRDSFGSKENKKYRSSFFKLMTLNFKLSRVNEKWKDHARRASLSNSPHYHMDTIIAFNGLDSEVSKQASATFMTLFYELDQSSPDGDDFQQSRNIVVIPSALHLIDFSVRDSLVETWCEGLDSDERVEETFGGITSTHKKIETQVNYDDPHHHFCDVLRTAILCNVHYNKLLAKREFENTIYKNDECEQVFRLLLKSMPWYVKPLGRAELTGQIIESIPSIKETLSNNVFNEQIWSIAKHLKPLLIDRIPSLSDSAANNLSVLFVVLCKRKFPRVRGSLQGANRPYSLWKALKDGHSKVNSESMSLWEYESIYRPSLLHMMELVSLLVIWKSDNTINRFEQFVQFRKEILDTQIMVNDALDGEHHSHVIKLANILSLQKDPLGNSSDEPVFMRFWKKADPKIKSLRKHVDEHLKRKSLRWPS